MYLLCYIHKLSLLVMSLKVEKLINATDIILFFRFKLIVYISSTYFIEIIFFVDYG